MGAFVVTGVMNGLVLAVLGLLAFSDGPISCNGGSTSSFVRNDEKAHDMPLDSDVFRVPPGYNAPQQVFFFFYFLCFCLVSSFSIYLG